MYIQPTWQMICQLFFGLVGGEIQHLKPTPVTNSQRSLLQVSLKWAPNVQISWPDHGNSWAPIKETRDEESQSPYPQKHANLHVSLETMLCILNGFTNLHGILCNLERTQTFILFSTVTFLSLNFDRHRFSTPLQSILPFSTEVYLVTWNKQFFGSLNLQSVLIYFDGKD